MASLNREDSRDRTPLSLPNDKTGSIPCRSLCLQTSAKMNKERNPAPFEGRPRGIAYNLDTTTVALPRGDTRSLPRRIMAL